MCKHVIQRLICPYAGVSNDFLINTRNETALIYNDVSVNENMHLATAFKIMRRPGNDLLEHLPADQYRFFRRTVIQIVLATDMAGHSELLQVSPSNEILFVITLYATVALYSVLTVRQCSCANIASQNQVPAGIVQAIPAAL